MLTLITSDGFELILDASEIVALKAQEDHTIIYTKSGQMFGVKEHIRNLCTVLSKIQRETQNVQRSVCHANCSR